jgi:hypothetical protein
VFVLLRGVETVRVCLSALPAYFVQHAVQGQLRQTLLAFAEAHQVSVWDYNYADHMLCCTQGEAAYAGLAQDIKGL